MNPLERFSMWLRRVSPSAIYASQAELKSEGIEVSVAELVQHYLASDGDMDGLARVVAVARQHALPIDFNVACALVLAGQEERFREDMANPVNRQKHLQWWKETKTSRTDA